jgi:hypothetical protein
MDILEELRIAFIRWEGTFTPDPYPARLRRTFRYDLVAGIQKRIRFAWDILGTTAVGKTLTLDYKILGVVHNELTLEWDSDVVVGESLTLDYDIATSFFAVVGNSILYDWDIAAPLVFAVGQSLTLDYEIHFLVPKGLLLDWEIFNEVGESILFQYDLSSTLTAVWQSRGFVWDIDGFAGRSILLAWEDLEIVARSLDIQYNIISDAVGRTLLIEYDSLPVAPWPKDPINRRLRDIAREGGR